MASQRRFEGPVLEDLLDRVRAEAGPSAQIVAANRVRKGGLGGFFTREFFEVIVDIVDEPTAAAAKAKAPKAASRRARRPAEHPGAPAPAAATPMLAEDAAVAHAAAAPAHAPAHDGQRRVPASILDLAEAVNDTERTVRQMRAARSAPPPPRTIDLAEVDPEHNLIDLDDDTPVVSTETSRFASILERLSNEIAPAGDDDDDELVVRSPAPVEPAPRAPSPRARRGGAGIADEVQERLEHQAGTARRTATAARVTSDPVVMHDDPVVTMPTAFGARVADTQPAAFRRVPRTEQVIERPETVLARLGLPARLVPRGAAPKDLRGALIQSLSDLPPAPAIPDANGVVIAVVGTGSTPVLLARELCAEYGLDIDRIVLATQEPLGAGIPAWLQINDGPTAEERRRAWHRRNVPTFVAVSLPPGRESLRWARGILDQLEPTISWSIVNAGWKPEDVRDWIERLGGIDVLALTHINDTVSPAAVLDLGLPVGRIDGEPATPLAWSELLLARMQK